MRLSPLTLLATLTFSTTTTTTLAFQIAPNTTDGVYDVFVDEAGVSYHTKLSELGHSLFSSTPSFSTTGKPEDNNYDSNYPRVPRRAAQFGEKLECAKPDAKGPLDPGWVDEANEDLDRQCGTGKGLQVKARHHIYAIRGDVAAFFCNNLRDLGWKVYCRAEDRRWTTQLIFDRCGPYQPGWGRPGFPVTGVRWGYHRIDSTKTFCGESHY